MKIVQINGVDGDELSFQHYVVPTWQTAYTKAVPAQKAVVRNLVVTTVKTNGTEDYFKYDPDYPENNKRPTIQYTIEDDGDAHEYDVYLLMWPTGIVGSLFNSLNTSEAYAWMDATHVASGTHSFTWDGSKIPQNYAGHMPDNSTWGTYAFEICVFEYQNSQAQQKDYIDWYYLRWPYCLGITNDPSTGHDVWITTTDEGDELRCFYQLSDLCESDYQYSNNETPLSVGLQPLDGLLRELCTPIPGNTGVGEEFRGDNGQGIITYSASEISNISRVVFTGEDACWIEYRRDHLPARMLAVNAVPNKDVITLEAWLNIVNRIQKHFYDYKPTDNNIKNQGVTKDTVNILASTRFMANRLNDPADHDPVFGVHCSAFDRYIQKKDQELANWFADNKNREFKTGNGTVDIIHFNATLGALLYNSPVLKRPATENYINAMAGWGGDVQTCLINLQEKVDIADHHNQKIINDKAKEIFGFIDSHLSLADANSDIDAHVIGTYYNADRPGFIDKRLYQLLYYYYKNGCHAIRYNRYVDTFDTQMEDFFMFGDDIADHDELTALKKYIGFVIDYPLPLLPNKYLHIKDREITSEEIYGLQYGYFRFINLKVKNELK